MRPGTILAVALDVGDDSQVAWLALIVAERKRRSNDGYDDDLSSRYSWDSTVPNRDAVQVGHVLVLWDKRTLLGASVIEDIHFDTQTKPIYRCAGCGSSSFEPRKTKSPQYRCFACKAEFDEPIKGTQEVRTFQSEHGAAWVDLDGALDGPQLRALCVKPKAQNSFRRLDWPRFQAALAAARPECRLTALGTTIDRLRSGHGVATVRVRVGQGDFRRRLVKRYDNVCAFTGRAPLDALEAAHLYSYAATGVHHDEGGFLLRRDLHRLFDLGLLAVHPDSCCLDVDSALAEYPEYARLQAVKVSIPLSGGQRDFLSKHWKQHRAVVTE